MSQRKSIFKDAGIYTLSSYIAQVFDVVNGVLFRRFLGPSAIGVWTFLQVIQNYAKHSSLGVTMATARDVPYFLEKGDAGKVEHVKNLVFTFTVLTSALTSLAIAVYALLNRGRFSPEIFTGLFVVAAIILLQRMYNLYVVILRSHKEFVLTGLLNIFSSVTSVLLTLTLTWKFKLYGFYSAMILNYLLSLAIILKKTPYRFAFTWNFRDLGALLGLGFAVLIGDVLRSILTSIDRLVITRFLGFEALGIYSVALMADNYLYALPNMFGVVFFPHFQEVFAKRDNPADLEKYLMLPTLSLAYFFPLIIGMVWCASDWFVPVFLPQYVSGITALKILSLGSFFLAFTHSFVTFFITIRRHWLLIPITAAAIALGLAITIGSVKMGWGIEGVAAAESLLGMIYFILLSCLSLGKIHNAGKFLLFYAKLAGIFIYFAGLLTLLDRIMVLPHPLLRAILQYAAFAAGMTPILWLGEKETRVLSTVFQMLRGKLSPKTSGSVS